MPGYLSKSFDPDEAAAASDLASAASDAASKAITYASDASDVASAAAAKAATASSKIAASSAAWHNTVTSTKYWASTSTVIDDGTVALPTITANSSAHGFIQVSSSGIINESAEFEIDSTGTAQIIRGTANVVENADTDGKVCIGTAAAQNPMTVKNRLGGSRTVMITLWYN